MANPLGSLDNPNIENMKLIIPNNIPNNGIQHKIIVSNEHTKPTTPLELVLLC